MNIRLVPLLLLCVTVGLLLLQRNRETLVPYRWHHTPAVAFLDFNDGAFPMFDLQETVVEAQRLRDLADALFLAGRYPEAIEALEQALTTYSFLDGVYERLSFAYPRTGQWRQAREAFEAWHAQHNTIVLRDWYSANEAEGLPEVEDWTQRSGLDACTHHVAFLETDLGAPGVAVADFSGDGHLEVICLGGTKAPTRLFRQRQGVFSAVDDTGIEELLPSQGVYVADLTNSGLPDVIVTGVGESWLYINEGNLQFRSAPLPLPRMWASAAAVADFTGNGHLDLVVGGWIGNEIWDGDEEDFETYHDMSPEAIDMRELPNPDAPLHLLNIAVRYGVPVRLLEGDGNGGFVDVTEQSGVDVSATTLNLELIDVNENGHLDLVIINDSMPARLFLGDGEGRFRDVTLQARFADVRAGMGLAIADFDGDGHWDFVKTHFQGEMHGLFMSDGFDHDVPRYRDASLGSGLGPPSLPYVGWAAFAWDFNANGKEDLLVINGHTRLTPHPMQLFSNANDRFVDVSGALPRVMQEPLRGRGAALFDLDGDGYDDLLVAQNNSSLRLFKMTPTHNNQWLRVRVRVPDIDALGGVVELVDSMGRRQRRPVRTGSTFFSSQPRDFYFGLGQSLPATLIWNGRKTQFSCTDLKAGRIVTLTPSGCETE